MNQYRHRAAFSVLALGLAALALAVPGVWPVALQPRSMRLAKPVLQALASGSTGLAKRALQAFSGARPATVSASPGNGRHRALQHHFGGFNVMVSASPGKGLHGAVIEFRPVLVTPRQRANLSDMGFFHVLILKMRACPVSTFSGLGVPTRKDGSMSVYM